ncbi:MAG: putative GTP cyclohydrolase 1 type 2 [Chlorobi bacterium OLB5]|nr:MAG: putative GTP cyclohydrolase 1 type 2 [Chlorobi bacterium OLB5]
MANAAGTAQKYFGKANIKSIKYVSPVYAKKFKVVVFVPLESADELSFKMASAGAGNIGKYSLCSFRTKGIGTFMGSRTSNPATGTPGKFEMTEEIRLEMICPRESLDKVINIIYASHPYEEPACEIYPVIVKETQLHKDTALIELKKPVILNDVMKKMNRKIELPGMNIKAFSKKYKRIFIDLAGKTEFSITPAKEKTLVIKKINNIINIEVI